MRWKALLIAGSIAPLSGCLLARDTARNLINEPAELVDNKKLSHRLRRDSRTVWSQVCQQYPSRTFSHDFAEGFEDGYVDYLESGGTAQPPAVPPIRYRRSRFMSVEGHARIRDYSGGFKYGCDTAAASGQRELITLPILLPEPPPESAVQARQISPQRTETLPAPRAADTGTGLPLLDRPLAIKSAPMTTPPVIQPPQFTAPNPELPAGPRSEMPTSEPLNRVSFTTAPGAVLPLREIPNSTVKPLRDGAGAPPIPPWRGN